MPLLTFTAWNAQRVTGNDPSSSTAAFGSPQERYKAFVKMVKKDSPDLLFVSESYPGLTIPGYEKAAFGEQKTKFSASHFYGADSGLNLTVFRKQSSKQFEILAPRMPTRVAGQARRQVAVPVRMEGQVVNFHFVHLNAANTSREGMEYLLDTAEGGNNIVIGDMNFDLNVEAKNQLVTSKPGVQVFSPLGRNQTLLTSTHKGGGNLDYFFASSNLDLESREVTNNRYRVTPESEIARVASNQNRGLGRHEPRDIQVSDHLRVSGTLRIATRSGSGLNELPPSNLTSQERFAVLRRAIVAARQGKKTQAKQLMRFANLHNVADLKPLLRSPPSKGPRRRSQGYGGMPAPPNPAARKPTPRGRRR